MNEKIIYGIQQIGVGVDNAEKAFEWYATRLGADVPAFDDSNTATHMARYMGGSPHAKRAILAINMQGGSGYELWQYIDRVPQHPSTPIALGDWGVCIAKVKSHDIERSFDRLKKQRVDILSEISTGNDGCKCFYCSDPWGNMIQIKESASWFNKRKFDMGGVFGAFIGVSDMEKAMKLYAGILGYTKVLYDKTGPFDDWKDLPNGKGLFRRVLLTHEPNRTGGFSPLFGQSQIELIQALDQFQPKKIYAGRYWGDIGFIHLCFDIRNMNCLVEACSAAGFPFTVLSQESFDMGEANGRFGYIEDPDGTLIEFVETRKVPILKKWKLAINLVHRNPHKPLPRWIIKAMSFKRKKFK